MFEIITKEFENSEIRTLLIDNEPWFIAKDIAIALNYPKSSISTIGKLLKKIPDEWRDRKPIPTLGGEQELAIISEQGLYFFVNRSDKPNAIPFQKWIAGKVLPSIRKTGSYSLTEQPKEKGRDDLISVSDSELDKELKTLDFLLSRVHFSEKEKMESRSSFTTLLRSGL